MKIIKANLSRAQHKMKEYKYKQHKDVTFKPNDWVLLKLQPYRQQSLSRRTSQKLSCRYYGPNKVVRRIGMVAYELELPPSSKLHPVFHVSMMRRFYGDDPRGTFVQLPPLAS